MRVGKVSTPAVKPPCAAASVFWPLTSFSLFFPPISVLPGRVRWDGEGSWQTHHLVPYHHGAGRTRKFSFQEYFLNLSYHYCGMNCHIRRLLLLFGCRIGRCMARQANGLFPVLSVKRVELPPAQAAPGLAGSVLPAMGGARPPRNWAGNLGQKQQGDPGVPTLLLNEGPGTFLAS